MTNNGKDFEPRIIAFLCNWCTYAAADTAGVSRMQQPPNVDVVRVMCTSPQAEGFLKPGEPILPLSLLGSIIDIQTV